MRKLIRTGLLIDGTGGPVIPGGALLIDDGRIAAVGPFDELQATQHTLSDSGVVDLSSYTVMPGLIDSHVHLFGSPAPKSLWTTQYESDARLAIRASANAREGLAAGLTTMRDCGARGDIVLSLTKAINEGMIRGPRIVNSGAPITTTSGHCYYFGIEAEGIVGVQRAVRQLHKQGVDFIKVMVTGGGLTAGSNTRASQYSQAELCAMVEDAHRLGHKIAGHVHGTEGIRRAVAAGFDSIEHCSWLAASEGQDRDYVPAIVEQILDQGIFVCRSIAGFERVPLEEANRKHRFWRDHEVFRNMARAGVKIVAGTDAGIDKTLFSGFAYTLETMAGLGEMTPAAVLASATRVAAEALGLEDEIGTLEVGKRADLVALSGNPLEDLRVLRHVDVVMRDGTIVARGGQVVGL